MKYFPFLFSVLLGLAACKTPAGQNGQAASDESPESGIGKAITVAFYNVENLFDTEDTPDKIDEDFLPDGKYKWNTDTYLNKLDNLARAIEKIGDADGPEILGLAEVENKQVIEDLVQMTSLKGHKYRIVHEESPDMRGIDVALVYDPKAFVYQSHKRLRVSFPQEADYTSRDILLVEGKVRGATLYVLVNHWPSRRGGQAESESRRLRTAEVAKAATDSLYALDGDADILLMGDFNDDPHNKSIVETMGATSAAADMPAMGFYNPMAVLHDPEGLGTLTYRGKWNLFDQMLVSKGLVTGGNKLKYIGGSAAVYNPEFLQVGFGKSATAPRRAIFRGEFVPEGFSDHFPVYVRLQVR